MYGMVVNRGFRLQVALSVNSLNLASFTKAVMHELRVNLKISVITFGSIVKWLAHFLSTEEILAFDCNYFVIKFSEFIDNTNSL